MALFLSTTTNKIDKKGRVSVPAQFRTVLAMENLSNIVIYCAVSKPILEGCDYNRLLKISEHLEMGKEIPIPGGKSLSWDQASVMFAEAQLISFDPEGRVSIPPALLEYGKMTEAVTFVGRGPTFELWNPDLFQEHHQRQREILRKMETSSEGMVPL